MTTIRALGDGLEHLGEPEWGLENESLGGLQLGEGARTLQSGSRARMEGEAHRCELGGQPPHELDETFEALRYVHVRRTVRGHHDAATRARLMAGRGETPEHVGDRVADDLDPLRCDALVEEEPPCELSRRELQGRGRGADAPVQLLERPRVERAESGLEVCNRHPESASRERVRRDGVRVTECDDQVERSVGQVFVGVRQERTDAARLAVRQRVADVGFERQVGEEGVGEERVVVLTRRHRDHVVGGLAHGGDDRCELDDLGTGPEGDEDAHHGALGRSGGVEEHLVEVAGHHDAVARDEALGTDRKAQRAAQHLADEVGAGCLGERETSREPWIDLDQLDPAGRAVEEALDVARRLKADRVHRRVHEARDQRIRERLTLGADAGLGLETPACDESCDAAVVTDEHVGGELAPATAGLDDRIGDAPDRGGEIVGLVDEINVARATAEARLDDPGPGHAVRAVERRHRDRETGRARGGGEALLVDAGLDDVGGGEPQRHAGFAKSRGHACERNHLLGDRAHHRVRAGLRGHRDDGLRELGCASHGGARPLGPRGDALPRADPDRLRPPPPRSP